MDVEDQAPPDVRTAVDPSEVEDDLEGMDVKAKALTNLLKTSSVRHCIQLRRSLN